MIDINADQRRASNPLTSVWVSASAGSGKTKVLTDRVLNLLLMTGEPEKLLCLTFTKAAAAEMANRIGTILKKWAVCPEPDLVQNLIELRNETPDADLIIKARRLFAKVLEAKGGMKIMTIHSFCQSVLKRFPLEAGVSPDFEIIDDRTADHLLNDTLNSVLLMPEFAPDIQLLARYQTPDGLIELLQEMFSFRSKLMKLRERSSLSTLIYQLKQHLNLTKYDTERDIVSEWFDWEQWPEIRKQYLTNAGVVKKYKEKDPIGPKVMEVNQDVKNLNLIRISEKLLHLAYSVLEQYQRQKTARGLLDYGDLIDITKHLLERSHAAAWVLFKLDGGVDHILVDEAQDTNPDQWAIVRLIAEEFFAGADYHDAVRTIFAVGDKKQSIYSFQGADPNEFERMRLFFENKIKSSENDFETVPFNLSFRSTQPILDVVNALLKNPNAADGVLWNGEEAFHLPYRAQDAGLVEIWPVEKSLSSDEPPPWKPPVERIQNQSSCTRLAEKIADKIQTLIRSKEILESQNRPIMAGDFLILVQRRNQFVSDLVRSLKERNIPVAGIDRLNLSTHIAVQDLIAAAKFVLLPDDDLNLACLLKSPLFKMTEEELFTVAYDRGEHSLWDRVQKLFPAIAERLNELLALADKVPPYEFFAFILGPFGGRKSILARLGSEAGEAIDEFLNLILSFEKNDIPNLETFVRFMTTQEIEIKRDMESAQNAVRIMTVHGSKGLQGNIVFLPQTRYIKPERPPFVFINDIPVWVPNQGLSSLTTDELLEEAKGKGRDENHRLLYVAVTRARDRFYICGYDGKNETKTENWYDLICASLKGRATNSDGIIRISSPQIRVVDPTDNKESNPPQKLPDWARLPAPVEPIPPKPLSPSKPTEEEPVTDSPLSAGQAAAMARGQFIHGLLQYLPEIPRERWDTAIKRLKPQNIDVPENLTSLLTSKEFAPVFGENSLAEVPVVGVFENKAFSGQIDRLVVREKEVWIVDFKTNRHVPQTATEVPKIYKNQLRAYRGLISQIFSDKVIRTFLLWTENLNLMEIHDEN